MRRALLLTALAFFSPLHLNAEELNPNASYQEIPYYLHKLSLTQLEGEQIEYEKIIHDAVANADLSSANVVRKMKPMMVQIQAAIDAGIDRPNLTGQANWLASARDYYEREKNKPLIDIPKSDWMETQTFSLAGLRITVFPDKIYLHENQQKKVIVQQPNIHEAILSPNGKWLAYFTEAPTTYEASIWIMSLKKRKVQLLTKANSGMSLLFSLDGDQLFFQEKPEKEGEESPIYSISSSGGRAERFTHGRELVGVVKQGKHKGAVLIRQERLHHLGVTKLKCVYAFTTGGKNLGRLKNINCE